MPFADPAIDYMRDLSSTPAGGEPLRFTIKQIQPKHENPSLDYVKLIVMLAGALAAGLLYDALCRREELF